MTKLSAITVKTSNVLAGRVFSAVKNIAAASNAGKLNAAATYAFGNESYSEAGQSTLMSVASNIESDLKRAVIDLGMDVTSGQLSAASESMLMASNVRDALARPAVVQGNGSTPFVGMAGLADGMATRTMGLEAYNETDNVNVLASTVTFNILAGRQNKAGELLFPTVTVPSDNVGVSVTIRLYQVHDDIKRAISGARANFNRRSIHRGMIDHTILHNDSTMAIPVHRAESASVFSTAVPAYDVVNEGETIKTGALLFGKTVDFTGLSQTDTLLASGIMTREDDLDPDVRLKAVYLKVGANVVRFDTINLALSNFIATGQDNYRAQKLNFETTSLVLQKTTKTIAAADLAGDLAGIVTDNLMVRLGITVNGSVNIEQGDLVAHANGLTVLSVYDADTRTEVSTASGAGAALKVAIEAGELVGYDVRAYRSNANKRQRGQLLDTTFYTQMWAVPYRSPLSALRPVNAPAQADGADLEALASATFIRTSSEAITTLLETANILSATSALELDPTAVPETLGVARMLLKPTYLGGNIDIATQTNSLTSHELELDIAAVLVNRVRDLAYRLYRDSEFQAVVESGAAGTTDEPVVCVVTDPMTARYLFVSGDVRLGGPSFKMQVETTPDQRMQGKIAVVLGYPGQSDGVVNALHFGNMLWSPELALVLPISRDGKVSKELTVQPRFRHIVNVPVLGMLGVTGLPEVVAARVPISFKDVT